MDDLVRQALAKWPDVPDCTGWLALDARGRWRIGEIKDGPRQPITNGAIVGFINRNYVPIGPCWAFQNGPQRVFVELEYTPFVWRLVPRADGGWTLTSHTGLEVLPSAVWLDTDGRFVVEARPQNSPAVVGVVHDHDTTHMAAMLHDDAGQGLDDDAIVQLTTSDFGGATTMHATRLHWARGETETPLRLPLQRIASHQVASRFGFDPKPSLAVKVDVDTRR